MNTSFPSTAVEHFNAAKSGAVQCRNNVCASANIEGHGFCGVHVAEVQRVSVCTTIEDIYKFTSQNSQCVIAVTAIDDIREKAALDGVIARSGVDSVDVVSANNRVIAARSGD